MKLCNMKFERLAKLRFKNHFNYRTWFGNHYMLGMRWVWDVLENGINLLMI